MSEGTEQFDWSKYTGTGGGEGRYFKPELGKKYRIKIASLTEGSMPEKDSAGALTGKKIPCLHYELSSIDGVKQEPLLPWDSTSKTLARGFMPYHKDGVLFDYEFDVAKVQIGGKQFPEFQVTPVLKKQEVKA